MLGEPRSPPEDARDSGRRQSPLSRIDSVEVTLRGLCERCRWCREVPNRRGTVYLLCRRSEEDPSYPRYPALPVLECGGFEPVSEASP